MTGLLKREHLGIASAGFYWPGAHPIAAPTVSKHQSTFSTTLHVMLICPNFISSSSFVVQCLSSIEGLAVRRIPLQRSRFWVDPAVSLITSPVRSMMSSVQHLRCRPRLLLPGVHPGYT